MVVDRWTRRNRAFSRHYTYRSLIFQALSRSWDYCSQCMSASQGLSTVHSALVDLVDRGDELLDAL